MKLDSNSLGNVTSSAAEPSVRPNWSTRSHAPLPARALGPKAKVLLTRRRRQTATSRRPKTAIAAGSTLSTKDLTHSVHLAHSDSVLYVERAHRRPAGVQITQSMVFVEEAQFLRWCNADPLCFAEPNLHLQILKLGKAFFDVGR